MKQKEFITVVLDHKILTLDEVTNLMKHFNKSLNSPVGFPVAKRSGPRSNLKRCCRFSSVNFGWTNNGINSISFSVDRDIFFHGVYLLGSRGSDYSVTLRLENDLDGVGLASAGGTFSSERHWSGKCYGFDVLFTEPILLRRGVYVLNCDISGPKSWYGTQGNPTVHCSGVTFTVYFKSEGQVSEFIFSQAECARETMGH